MDELSCNCFRVQIENGGLNHWSNSIKKIYKIYILYKDISEGDSDPLTLPPMYVTARVILRGVYTAHHLNQRFNYVLV